MKQPTLSVIMPALNEEKNIEAAINSTFEALKKFVFFYIMVWIRWASDCACEGAFCANKIKIYWTM